MRQVIEMEHPAVAFIQQHGGVVTVRRSPRHGCCGGTAHIAVAELGVIFRRRLHGISEVSRTTFSDAN